MDSMTPSKCTTEGQIDKAVVAYRALLTKHQSDFSAGAFQEALGNSQLIKDQFAVLRTHVEAISNMIVRHVSVNRNRSPQEALGATGRIQYVQEDVVEAMPRADRDEAEVFFFNLDRFTNDTDLDKEYELRGLKACDPLTLAGVNEADLAFADDHPNCTHWKDAEGRWCFATFYRWRGRRYVHVRRDGHGWHVRWWFAGLRK